MIVRRLRLVLVLLATALPALSQEAIFVVRHAEKQSDSNDPPVPLSEAGTARARRLAELLKDAGVTAILSTDMVRTRSTAEPLARMRNLPIETYAARDPRGVFDAAALAGTLRERHAKDVVLVVGHSNTVGPLLSALGCPGEITIGANEYDNLFVVVPRGGRAPELLRLRF
jgi:phosphohistidine phosphatase SixA